MSSGIYRTTKKNGQVYFRSSITYRGKHISLGSSENEQIAGLKYELATRILRNHRFRLNDYHKSNQALDYEKWVILINFRDNGIYFKTPIYLYKSFFHYHLTCNTILTFDVDDLFFYSTHKIFRRGNYFFVNDFGMQYNILSRYGIRNYASAGKDFLFLDNDSTNFRYENIDIINPYQGVEQIKKGFHSIYRAKVHLNGYIIIGYYSSIHKAAVAYNKAIDFIHAYISPNRNYTKNYIDILSDKEIQHYYQSIRLPSYLIALSQSNQ